MATSKKTGAAAANKLAGKNRKTAAKALAQAPGRRGSSKMPVTKSARSTLRDPAASGSPAWIASPTARPHGRGRVGDERPRPESVDDETIARLVAEAEAGIPAEKLRRRGRPAIGDEAARTFSVRLPDDLVVLADERSAIDCVTRGETIRRALIEYLTK
jgi:hypothetical protein